MLHCLAEQKNIVTAIKVNLIKRDKKHGVSIYLLFECILYCNTPTTHCNQDVTFGAVKGGCNHAAQMEYYKSSLIFMSMVGVLKLFIITLFLTIPVIGKECVNAVCMLFVPRYI